MRELRLIDLRGISPHDHYPMLEALVSLIGRGSSPDTMLIVQFSGEHAILGKGAKMSEKIRVDYCLNNEVSVIRTFIPHGSSGFHDSKTIKCLLVLNQGSIADRKKFTELLSKFIVEVLRNLGLSIVYPLDSSNLLHRDKKIGMCSSRSFKGCILFSANLFIESSVERAEQIIISPRDMRSTSAAIADELSRGVSTNEVFDSIRNATKNVLEMNLKDGGLSSEEKTLKNKMAEKYSSESWLRYGKWSPVKDYWRPK